MRIVDNAVIGSYAKGLRLRSDASVGADVDEKLSCLPPDFGRRQVLRIAMCLRSEEVELAKRN
jgi:hypothetical protein